MGTAKGVKASSGCVASSLECLVDSLTKVVMAGIRVAKKPLRPVLESEAGMATTTVAGSTLSSLGAVVGGAGGAIGSVILSTGIAVS